MSAKRTTWMAVSILACVAILAACTTPATEAPAASQAQGTLTIGLTTAVTAVEFPYAPERQSANAAWSLFDSLIYQTADGKLEPALATGWEVSDDSTEYTFTLRQGVTFHDGSPFNADSVVFSWNTYKQPEVTYGNYWAQVANVEKVDDFTVKMTTESPDALLLRIIATNWSMIPVDWGGKTKEEFAEHPIGTGPFMLKEWVKGDHMTVVANPTYWREGYPKLAEVVFKFLPESSTRVSALQAGEIDIAPRLSAEEADSLSGAEGIEIKEYLGTRIFYVSYNNLTSGVDTPIADPMVRQAMAHAVDVPAIIDSLFDGNGVAAAGLVGQGELGFDGAAAVAYDPDLAKQMLADAGYPEGFAIGMACPDQGYTHINEVCQAIQGYFSEVGIETDLNIMESNAYWELEATQQLPPLFVDGWSVTIPEGFARLKGSLGKGETYAAWYDERMDTLISEIATTVDTDARAAKYAELQELMREDPPFIYLYQIKAFEGVRSRVVGYQPRNAEDYFLWDVSVTD